jgi:hypothetical protein
MVGKNLMDVIHIDKCLELDIHSHHMIHILNHMTKMKNDLIGCLWWFGRVEWRNPMRGLRTK